MRGPARLPAPAAHRGDAASPGGGVVPPPQAGLLEGAAGARALRQGRWGGRRAGAVAGRSWVPPPRGSWPRKPLEAASRRPATAPAVPAPKAAPLRILAARHAAQRSPRRHARWRGRRWVGRLARGRSSGRCPAPPQRPRWPCTPPCYRRRHSLRGGGESEHRGKGQRGGRRRRGSVQDDHRRASTAAAPHLDRTGSSWWSRRCWPTGTRCARSRRRAGRSRRPRSKSRPAAQSRRTASRAASCWRSAPPSRRRRSPAAGPPAGAGAMP